MPISKFLDPKNDWAFKRIFGSEKNKDILLHFLNDIFAGQTGKIQDITFLKSIQEPEVTSQRVSIVDIMCQAINGDRFIVEMQVSHEAGFEKRAQFYAARAYIDQRQAGIAYKDLKQVIFLAITEFNLFPNKPGYLSHHHVLDVQTNERDLKDFSFSFLELPKFNLQQNQLKTMVEKWAYFFKNAQQTSEKDVNKIAGSDVVIENAFEQLNRFSWTPEELRTYDSIDMKICADRACLEGAHTRGLEEGKIEGIEIGKDIGIEIGQEKAMIKVVSKLLKENYPIETIANITGLKIEQITKLS